MELSAAEQEAITFRQELHRHPELGYHEEKTASMVARWLGESGLDVHTGMGGTGVVGLLKIPKAQKTLLMRADMDALPIVEDTHLAFSSENEGVMHACGHDGHMAMLLAAARYLSTQARDQLNANILFIFQPAEEGGMGAGAMLRDGLLERYDVDHVLGIHLWNELPVGTLAVGPGPVMAAVDEFSLTVKGQGGHGAMPQDAKDPIIAMSTILLACQSLVSRRIAPREAGVVTFGKIQGGTAFNIIPTEVRVEGTIRSFDPMVQATLYDGLEEISRGIAGGMECQASLERKPSHPATISDSQVALWVRKVGSTIEGLQTVGVQPSMGGEDFSLLLEQRPGAYFFLGSWGKERKNYFPHHHPSFQIDEKALALGVRLWVALGLDYSGSF